MPSSKYDQYRKELHRVMQKPRSDIKDENIKVGDTPSVLKLIGYEDLPLFLSGRVIWKVAFDPVKERFIPEETLGKIGEAIEDPLFIEKSASDSSQPNNSILIHTELEHNGEKLAVVVHLSKEKGGYTIHNIASVYARSQSQKDRVLDEGRLLYLNTEKGFSEFSAGRGLQSPRRENLKNLFVDGKVFTQDDLSQYKNSKNLKFSFRDTRSEAELGALNNKHRELYERYKNGDQAAYEEAAKLVAEEAKRKEYEVKVYHGTGSDGFNVADASSKYEENGEGNQAHGAGLYMAVSRNTAEGYRHRADKSEYLTVGGKRPNFKSIENLDLSKVKDILVYMFENGLEDSIEGSKADSKVFAENIDSYQREYDRTKDEYSFRMIERSKDLLEWAKTELKFLQELKKYLNDNNLSEDDVKIELSDGHIFDWFTNLNKENTLDEDKPLNKQSKTVREAIATYYKSRPDDYHSIKESELGDNTGREFFKDLIFQMRREGAKNPQLEASKLLAKLGIKGLTYNGRQDGRCYVSFEGGATVKLQDPFTFNDKGELIPLTERFDDSNPDMRFSIRDNSMPSDAEIAEAERQIEEVRATYVNTPQWLKAPNGADTKLTERQWLLVRTPNFKKWFGDWENDPKNASKVVDENGEPLVVYHGSSWNPLKEKPGDAVFKSSFIRNTSEGVGFNFTKDKSLASGFGDGKAYFLNLRNPVYAYSNLFMLSGEEAEDGEFDDIEEENRNRIKKAVYQWKASMQNKGWKFYDEIDSDLLDGLIKETNTVESVLDYILSADGFVKDEDFDSEKFYNDARDTIADVFGIDGYISKEYAGGAGAYIAFNSEQIKSATDNVGTYSENPDIRFSSLDIQKPDASNFDFTEEERALYEAAVVPKYYSRGSKQAVKDLKTRLKIPQIVKNEKLQLSGILSAGTLKELNSERAMSKTEFTSTAEVHSVAIANVEELFKGAIFDIVSPDRKGKLKGIHRLYAPMFYNGKVYGVQITVKESKNEITIGDKSSNNKIYSIEAIDVENLFAKTPQEWESEYKRRNEKYLKKEDFEMSGELIVPKSERPDSPNSYELFSKSARSFLEDILNVNKKIAAKNVSAKFSAIDSDFEARKRKAMLSEMMLKYGIRGYKYKSGYGRNKNNVESWNYVSFEGRNALKRREVITRDKEGKIIPPSERYDKANSDWNFSLEEMDEPLTEREQKNIETFKRNIQNGSSRLDISQNKAYKESGLNCNRIIMRKSVMDKAEKLGIDTDKISYELLRPTAIPKENRYIKQIRILTSLKGKQDKQVCFQGNIDKNNLVVLDDILGYRQEAINALLEEEMRYINKEKARLLVRGGSQEPTHIDKPNELSERDRHLRERHLKTGASVRPDEPSFKNVASEYSRPSQAIYSEDLEKAMDTADKAFEGKKDKVVNSLRNMGVEVTEDKRSDTKSQYIDVHLDNGSTIYVRVSNHPAKTRIDVSIEKDWKAGTRFIYDQVEKNDWGTKNNPYWQGDARLNFSLADEETSEKERKKLERENEARAQITSPRARIVQATTDAFAPLAALERVLYGKVRGAEKSAWKMALMTKNLDQAIFHVLRVGGIAYDKATGEMKHRKGSMPLEKILNRVRGKNYKNFENYALAKCAIEHWAKLRKQKFYSDKDFANVFGFTLEDARKWASEGTENTKKAFADLQKFFQDKRDFMLETGLISENQHKALSEFKNYVPFFREGADLEAEMQEAFDRAAELNPGGRGMSARNSGIQKFIGSSRKTKNLIESIVNQTRREYDAGYKNIAMYRSLNLMRQIGMATYLKQDTVEVKAKLKEMKRALEEAGVDVGALSDEEIMQKAPIEAFADLTAKMKKPMMTLSQGT